MDLDLVKTTPSVLDQAYHWPIYTGFVIATRHPERTRPSKKEKPVCADQRHTLTAQYCAPLGKPDATCEIVHDSARKKKTWNRSFTELLFYVACATFLRATCKRQNVQ